MNATKSEINNYLQGVGWSGSLISWADNYTVSQWNLHETDKDAYEWFKGYRDHLFQSVKGEFEAKNSIGVCYCGECNKCRFG